jgi:hypothetical protein
MPINDVGDAMHEMHMGSKHIKSRAQAIAVGLKAEGKSNQGSTSHRKKLQKRAFGNAKKRVGSREKE